MSQLHITLGTAYQSFEQVVCELFLDRVNWGHIVAFFSFSATQCMKGIDKEIQESVSQVTTSMATYLNNHLEPWIQENGGGTLLWNSTKIVQQPRAKRAKSASTTGP